MNWPSFYRLLPTALRIAHPHDCNAISKTIAQYTPPPPNPPCMPHRPYNIGNCSNLWRPKWELILKGCCWRLRGMRSDLRASFLLLVLLFSNYIASKQTHMLVGAGVWVCGSAQRATHNSACWLTETLYISNYVLLSCPVACGSLRVTILHPEK